MLDLEKTEIETKLQSQTELAINKANSIVIASEQDLLLATDVIKFIKDKHKQAEKERKAMVEPFNTGVKNINARFKTITEPLEKAESDLKAKMLTFQRELEKQRREIEDAKRKEAMEFALEVASQAEAQGDTKQADYILNQVARVEKEDVKIEVVRGSNTGALSTITKRWKATEILDIQALAQAHPELVLPNMVEINKLVNSGVRELAGVKIEQVDNLSIR